MRVAAVVLAAGRSSRFGEPKQLALFRGETFVNRIAKAAIEAGCDPVVVVTGEESAQIQAGFKRLPVRVAANPDWPSGLASSIRAGLENAMESAPDLSAALLVTCDQPFVDSAVIRQLIQLHSSSGKPIAASAYAGTLGIPALFDRSCFPDLLQLDGDSGAKKLLVARPHDVASLDFPAGQIDIDTVTDYEKLDRM